MASNQQRRKFYKIQPKIYYYTFGPNKPVLHVKSGDTIVAPTRDARGLDLSGKPLVTAEKQRSNTTKFHESNPLVGPIYVEDAQVGDVLAIYIKEILLNRAYAWSSQLPHFGSFTGESEGKYLLLNEPLQQKEYRWNLDFERMVGVLYLQKSKLSKVEILLHPFIGSIGVAPRFGRVETSLTPGEYGGNMDCVETKENSVLYLPVWVEGAYLAFGDVHAAQGDGEICGTALETTAQVTLQVEVIKNKNIQWPRLEDKTHIMVIGSALPLMDAIRIAYVELIKWLVAEYDFDKREALQVISQIGTIRVGNVVDPNYTVVVKFPKKYLPC